MVSPLKYYKSDPMNKGRGSGFYYNRGGYKRGWKSKFSGKRDGNKKVTGASIRNLSPRYEHAGDRRKFKRTNRILKVSPRKTKRFFGWF